MDKRLFEEASLIRNIPKEIIEEINQMDSETNMKIFDFIFESEELIQFVKSINLPEIERIEKKSELLEEAIKTMKISNKKKK